MSAAWQWATAIWLLLAGATGVSWLFGHEAGDHRIASVVVILIAMTKIRFVMLWFMELRHAPLPWRAAFEGWMVLVATALLILYLMPVAAPLAQSVR